MTSNSITSIDQQNEDRQALISRRAYDIYLERGCGDGADMDDWLRAERELAEQLPEGEVSARAQTA